MAVRKDSTDRNGKSREMAKRGIRLTDEENSKLNELVAHSGMNLRDYISNLIEIEYEKLKGEN